MTALEMIIAAVAAGTAAGSTDVAKAAVNDAYIAFRDALLDRLPSRSRARQIILEGGKADTAWREELANELASSNADRDAEILTLAQHLLELDDPRGAQYGKYAIDMRNSDQPQVGDGTLRIETSYGPSAGTMTGPVTVNYEGNSVPPTKPKT